MKKLVVLTLVAALVAFVAVSFAKAAEPNDVNKPANDPNAPAQKDGVITIRGKLVVTKDEKDVITSVKVERKKTGTTHNIVLDAKGKELAETLAGKTVEVTGKETTKGDEKWLTVEKFAEKQRSGPGDPNKPHKPSGPGQQSGK
jgi:hypothetical protein